MSPLELVLIYFAVLNILSYLAMSTDKLKSIYQWWRISEKALWLFAIFGGVFGIWMGMQWPMYHKAGKRSFRLWIPVIAVVWLIFFCYMSF